MRHRAYRSWRTGALLCVAVLLLGCVPTRLANQGGSKDEPTATKAARKVIKGASTVKVAAPVQVEQKAEKEGTDPNVRIRSRLGEAEQRRRALFASVSTRDFKAQLDQKDERGKKLIRVYKLITFDDEAAEVQQIRSLYQDVLTMDPGNPQATLGLGNLALMEATSLLTRQSAITWRLSVDKRLSAEDYAYWKRKSELLQKRVGSALKAAHNKFKKVLQNSPGDPSAHLGIGMALALSANFAGAQKKFEQMERGGVLPPNQRSIFYVWHGFVLERLRKTDQAMAKYDLAAELLEPYEWGVWARDRVEEIFVFERR